MEDINNCIICGNTRIVKGIFHIHGEDSSVEMEIDWGNKIKICRCCEMGVNEIKEEIRKKNKEKFSECSYSEYEFLLIYGITNDTCGLEAGEYGSKSKGNKSLWFDCEWQKKSIGRKDKHVDIAIDSAKLYIEVDGNHHKTQEAQVWSDVWRNHYSAQDEGYLTLHIPNATFENRKFFHTVVDAIKGIASIREKPSDSESENKKT